MFGAALASLRMPRCNPSLTSHEPGNQPHPGRISSLWLSKMLRRYQLESKDVGQGLLSRNR